MPSEAVEALSKEIDTAVEEMTVEQAAGTELVKEEVGEIEDTSKEAGATSEEEKSEDVSEEVKEVEETDGEAKAGGEEESEGGSEETTPAHDESAIERAVAAGIPVADANALTSTSLERVITAREQAYAEQASLEERAALGAEREKAEKVNETDPFDQFPKLDPDKYEPEVIAAIEGLKDISRAQQEEIKDYRERSELAQETQNRANDQEMEQWYDKQVEDLGEDFVESLGKGNYRNLSQSSTQFENRAAIVAQMSVMDSGYRAQGIQPPSREDLFNTASRNILQDRYAELTEKRISRDLEKQSKQHIQRARGSGKGTSTLTPQEEAAAEIDAKYFPR